MEKLAFKNYWLRYSLFISVLENSRAFKEIIPCLINMLLLYLGTHIDRSKYAIDVDDALMTCEILR